MRILLVHPGPDFSVHDLVVLEGWLEALRELAGSQNVAAFNLNDRLVFFNHVMINTETRDETGHMIANGLSEEQIIRMSLEGLSHALYTFWPDVVIFVSGFFTNAGLFHLIRMRNHKIVLMHTESPYEDDKQLMRAEWADLNVLNDPANLEKFRDIGPAEYMPHCYRPGVHYPRTGPRDPEKASDFCFIGTAFDSRIRFFEAMNLDGTDTMIAGSNWGKLRPDSPVAKHIAIDLGSEANCVNNPDTAEYYRHALMGLNLYRQEGETGHEHDAAIACGPREIEMSACQLAFLRDKRPEGDELLHMLPTFDGPEDASEKLKWWLAHGTERERAASLARQAVQERTFVNNAKRLLKRLDDL